MNNLLFTGFALVMLLTTIVGMTIHVHLDQIQEQMECKK